MPGTYVNTEVPLPGKVVVKPIQANLTIDDELIGKMDPYCKISLGHHKGKTEVCKDGAKHPYWTRVISLKRKDEPFFEVKLKNKKFGLIGKTIGYCKIDLKNISLEGSVTKWFDISGMNNDAIGKILLDISFQPDKADNVTATTI